VHLLQTEIPPVVWHRILRTQAPVETYRMIMKSMVK